MFQDNGVSQGVDPTSALNSEADRSQWKLIQRLDELVGMLQATSASLKDPARPIAGVVECWADEYHSYFEIPLDDCPTNLVFDLSCYRAKAFLRLDH